jgi:Secretion system C-terminal sorting domain
MKIFFHKIIVLVWILFLLGTSYTYGQLTLSPSSIEFKDDFHRLQNIYFINSGTDTIQVDSIYYNSELNYNANLYLTRFNKAGKFPFTINPGDSILMDCILASYQAVSKLDTNDVMWVAINSQPARQLNIKIDFYNYEYGKIAGRVMDGTVPVAGASVSFFFNGNFLYRRVFTGSDGTYSVILPAADYTAAVESPGYYTDFYNNTFDALSSSNIYLNYNDSVNADFNLTKIAPADTSISITGKIIDYTSKTAINSGTVVIRRGTHNPSKALIGYPTDVYAALIKPDGTFRIEGIVPGNYYLQSFSSYYTPSFYSSTGTFKNFWYDADTLLIDNALNNIDVQMPRDSSFWGGEINGTISTNINSFQYPDIIVYALSQNIIQDSIISSYSTVTDSGKFSIRGLPYGDYKLVAQKIGYQNAVSSGTYSITESSTDIQNASIYFSSESNTIPNNVYLYQNYPNPFNPSTTIKFFLKQGEEVQLKVFNILGQQIAVLHDGFMAAGFHSFIFNGNNLSSGIYFISLRTGDQLQVKKMVLLK